ncbi:hypothetical protein MLD52_23220, partial [Puniceicoccaceae bacterium K14]|nr:hypothetical protein [Puniceicoccaceae bacterium K14]
MTIASAFNSSSINTTNHNVGSLSLNDPADLMISVAACNNSVSSWSGNWTDNFTQLAAVDGSNSAMAIAEQIDVSAGTYSTTTTTTTPRKTNAFSIALVEKEDPITNNPNVSKPQPVASYHSGYASSFTASLSGQPAEGNLLLLFFSAKQSAPN